MSARRMAASVAIECRSGTERPFDVPVGELHWRLARVIDREHEVAVTGGGSAGWTDGSRRDPRSLQSPERASVV